MSKSFAASITQPSWSADVEAIATAFARGLEAGMPRYLQLQNTVTRLIQAGELRAGGQLPPDQQLTAALGISLGTVQKALSNLASEGWITREHGRGTSRGTTDSSIRILANYCLSIRACCNAARFRRTNSCARRSVTIPPATLRSSV